MYRRPERIELSLAVVSTIVLFSIATYFYLHRNDIGITGPLLLSFLLLLQLMAIVGSTFAEVTASRMTILVVHAMLAIVLVAVSKGEYPLVEIAVVVILFSQISLRLPALAGSAVGGGVILLQIIVGLLFHRTLLIRLLVGFPEAVVLFFAQSAIAYRERLVGALADLDSQRQSIENLTAANQSFVEYLEEVEADSAEKERFRITRELHDSIGYSMTNIAMMMNASRYLVDANPDKLAEYCQKAKVLASSTLHETRDILYKLRSVEKHKATNARIFFTRLCQDFSAATNVTTECNIGNLPANLNDKIFGILFRALQAGLINALRHAEAGCIRVFFWRSGSELLMNIWNNVTGNWSDVEGVEEGIGLRGMRERLSDVKGTVRYGRVEDGFELTLTIPIEEVRGESHPSADRR